MAELSLNKLDNDITELIVKFEDRRDNPWLPKDSVHIPHFVKDDEGKLHERITERGVRIAPFTFSFKYKLCIKS
jgi:hypothetical protein